MKTVNCGIIDSTLREGGQFRYANGWSELQQIKILRLQQLAGVDFVEMGNPINPVIRTGIERVLRQENRPRVLVHVRNRLDDIEAALSLPTRPDGVNILCTINPDRLAGMGMKLSDHVHQLYSNVQLALNAGLRVRVGVEDYFSGNRADALMVYHQAVSMGADCISVPDTRGLAMPWQVTDEIGNLKSELDCEIEVHFHNDLGMAMANAWAAVRAGADWVDTTILGIGERSGIVSLSTWLANLYVVEPELVARRGYQLDNLTGIDNQVAEMLGVAVPFTMMTNRETGFAHAAGIHLNAIARHGASQYELFDPAVVGNERQLMVGGVVGGKGK